jgi:putative addiction module component (TIGR02574 family)
MTRENLQSQVATLSVEEKFELLDVVGESLETDKFSLSQPQRKELDYRLDLYERDPDRVIPWEQIQEDLFEHR